MRAWNLRLKRLGKIPNTLILPSLCNKPLSNKLGVIFHTYIGSRLASNQWETSLQSNSASHWLDANIDSALNCGQCTYAYDISQLPRKVICYHSWIDKLSIFSVILVWQIVEKNSINFCPGVYSVVPLSRCEFLKQETPHSLDGELTVVF